MIDQRRMQRVAEMHLEERLTVYSEQSRDQNQYLCCMDGQEMHRLNSAYKPVDEAVRWASQYQVTHKRSVVYLFGLGNGYFARALLKNLKMDSRLILIEPSYAIFHHAAEWYDLSDLFSDERTDLFLGKEGEGQFFSSIEQYVHWTNLASQMLCIHPGYEKLFPKELALFEGMLSRNNEKEIRNRNTEAHFGKKRTENVIRNLKQTREFYVLSDLKGCIPKGIPAVIVAAGPSLDRNVEQLKQVKGKAFLIACDTVLRFLHQHGIQPDAAITVDANKPAHYFDMAGFETIPVITTATANAHALQKNTGAKIWFSGQTYHIGLLKKLGIALSYRTGGGSVATAAFAVCASLGFTKIIFTGQDLAYGKEASHAGGETSRIRNEEEGVLYLDGIDGTKVKSRSDWAAFLQWYENAIKSVRETTEVIDATEGGARIPGSTVMTLLEAAERYCRQEWSFQKMLYEKKPYGQKYIEQIDQYIKQSYEDILLLIQYCSRSEALAANCLKALEEAGAGAVLDKEQQELSELNQNIQRLPVYSLVDEYARKETMESVQQLLFATGEEETDQRNEYRQMEKIHQELAKAAKEVRLLLSC